MMKRRRIMSDNEIRQILLERKRQRRKEERRAEILEMAEGFIGWASLFAICFMLSVIGG